MESCSMTDNRLVPGTEVTFVLAGCEEISGTDQPVFVTGTIDSIPIVACAAILIVPIQVECHDGRKIVVFMHHDHLLSVG
jgi:hypothetical protein